MLTSTSNVVPNVSPWNTCVPDPNSAECIPPIPRTPPDALHASRGEVFLEDDIVDLIGTIHDAVRIGVRARQRIVRAAAIPGIERDVDLSRAVAEGAGFRVPLIPVHRVRENVPTRAEPAGERDGIRGGREGCIRDRARLLGER
jgi:hypothetical protein